MDENLSIARKLSEVLSKMRRITRERQRCEEELIRIDMRLELVGHDLEARAEHNAARSIASKS